MNTSEVLSSGSEDQNEGVIPAPGEWPVYPQQDQSISERRIWIDGCFDFAHHGHAGAMLQAKQLGDELVIGVHSDEEILHNKGPTVMTLDERIAAVQACRWADIAIPDAPYVTQLPWVSHYGCKYVVHGDDITSDSNGEDCYRFVKAAGRFLVVKRTPGISTTDLVGRMLLFTKDHFIKNLATILWNKDADAPRSDGLNLREDVEQMKRRLTQYSKDSTGKNPWVEVWTWDEMTEHNGLETQVFTKLIRGVGPFRDQRVVYVDGSFDLFSSGHIEFLRRVIELEEERAKSSDWYSESKREHRLVNRGYDYSPVYVVAGIHDDHVVNKAKGSNYPIMNIYERSLCVLQCKYISALVFSAPFAPSKDYLERFPCGLPKAVYHGPTAFLPSEADPYTDAKALGIFVEIGPHAYQDVNAAQIVQRILKNRAAYEDRQRAKGVKTTTEEALHLREQEEETGVEKGKEKES